MIKEKIVHNDLQKNKSKRCFSCNKEIEEGLINNKDADGNEYCGNCVAKIQLLVEDNDEQ